MTTSITKTIVFITGAFVHSSCWAEWKLFFENKGYQVLVPSWPHKEYSADRLRLEHPKSVIATVRLSELTDFYASIVSNLPEKPILIGHSMGGLITQLLIQRDLAYAGIAIHSLQPQGVFTFKYSFYKAGWGPLGFFTSTSKTYLMSIREWQYAFTNGMSYEEQRDSYYRLLIPESKLVVRDAITSAAKIDFKKPHAPLLFMAGSNDRFIPPSLNFANFKKYQDPGSITRYKEFPGRNHFVLGQLTWAENAAYAAEWLENLSVAKHQ